MRAIVCNECGPGGAALRYHDGAMRGTLAILLLVPLALAGDDDGGLDQPLSSPLAKRKRAEADELGGKGRALHEEIRKGVKPAPEDLRKAIEALEEALAIYERAQAMEWSLAANADEMECLRSWVALREHLPPAEAPADPEEKARAEAKEVKAQKERARDARRFLTETLRSRRHRKVFDRCDRCDGRGELRSAFGDKSVCSTCRGEKLITNRKNLLEGYWLAHSPFYRADARERARLNYVLRSGVRGEKRIAPFIEAATISGKVEDHGWWFRFETKQKVIEEGGQGKATERDENYIVMNVGRCWWIHGGRVDRELLDLQDG